ncbi:hypothetical protein CK203_078077 [Vitis vinifera]|uniref:Uncharacterized protein n=1 Tax=Vitis vinifera TaxID=29760 RepID=A0A438EU32_VITVI|nr:hypothetical protein CK203_078077 [Vitis vinifera]
MGCLPINSRLSPYFAFFRLCFSPVSVFSSIFCLSSFSSEALGFPGGNIRVVTVTVLRFSTLFFQLYTRFRINPSLKMSANKEATSSSSPGDAHAEKSVNKLNVGSSANGAVQRWAPVSSAVVVQGVSSFHPDSPGLRPSQYGPGANGVQHYGHAVQFGPLTAGVGDQPAGFDQGGRQGSCAGQGFLGGFGGASGQAVCSQPIVEGPRLFEIAAAERSCETLLSAQTSVRSPGAPTVRAEHTPRRLPKEVVAEEHFVLQDLPFYAAVRKADARSRKARLNKREVKRQEGRLRKALGGKRPASSPLAGAPAKKKKKVSNKGKEVKLPTPRRSDFNKLARLSPFGCGRSRGLLRCSIASHGTPNGRNGSRKSEFASLRAKPLAFIPVKGPATRRSRPACDLKSGLVGRLQDRFLETIEVSCSSVQDDHPEGSEVEMAEENPAAPVLVPDGEGSPVDGAACISASSFSYAELEEKLKRIPPGSDVAMPSAKMFEVVEMLVSGLRGMTQQHDLFSDLLRIADYMKAFASQRRNSEEELPLRLERAEASLSAAREDNEALQVRQLRTEVSIEKKQREDLQLRLSAQKEELEGEFAMEREELEADYQKQVDEMYFFGYHCCMKKHGIKWDVPSIPPGEEEKLRGKPAQLSGCPLLIVCHPDGCSFSYFVCPVQISS